MLAIMKTVTSLAKKFIHCAPWNLFYNLVNLVLRLEMFVFLLPLHFFPQSKSYIFSETLGHLTSFEICAQFFCQILYNLQTRSKWCHKIVFFNCCRSRLCGKSIFHTLISAYKSYRLTKYYHDDTIFVYFTDQNWFSDFSQ